MDFKNIEFKAAYGTSQQIPESLRPEISFVGRSNVGKSSLINRLFNRKKLAKVSSKPGKTSTINFFSNGKEDFIDLPGYGYAQVSKSEKARWAEMINGYFDQYRYYALVVSLIDIRHAASKLDEQMVEFLKSTELPFCIALTKADKLSRSQQFRQRDAIRKQLGLGTDVPMIITSSEKGDGMDELKATIEEACK
ncbi:MAG: ribosome biogenesis GTP-binding protein YihA/YsxC [Coriobacteriia bacterium]|nr:ribosome biogenesis GTP-binding protein YihA/YsxC [Coriobacteriia bacterium]